MLKKLRENLDGLSDELKALYEQKADGKFHLNLEDDDAEPLRRAKEHEVGLRQIAERDLATARQELDTAKAAITQLQNDAGKDKSQLREQLQQEYEERERKLKEAHSKETEALTATVKKVYVDDVAFKIANDITDVPDLLLPLIEKRLQVEIIDGKPVTRVLKENGEASTMTPDELKQEYSQNKKFERIIRGSNASGGGASGGIGGSGAPKKLKDMNDVERKAYYERDPAGFQRESDALKSASGVTV